MAYCGADGIGAWSNIENVVLAPAPAMSMSMSMLTPQRSSSGRQLPLLKPSMLASALTKLSMVCASLLVLLALISLMSVPLLELDGPAHSPVPSSEGGFPAWKQRIVTERKPRKTGSTSPTTSDDMWASKHAEDYQGCSSPSSQYYSRSVSSPKSNGYILIQTSGGLNQQRTGIIDAVVAARILNATLVIPDLDHKSFWSDSSNFSDIFDVNWFISSLVSDVTIIKKLPSKLGIPDEKIHSTRVPRKCNPGYFTDKVLPLLQKKKVVRLTKFDYRLSNRLEEDLQKLRCRVNYESLRFTASIRAMGEKLVQRLRHKTGRYIALHLRFEPDMLAFSGCYYGGGEEEVRDLGVIRQRWKSLHKKNPERERRNGKCPLTPEEVGLMLRALGYGSDSHLYVASGEVYGGEKTLAPLKALFPNFYTKETLATRSQLKPFLNYSSRLAAIDYTVCDESDVFVTNNNGNMARILAGRRRYFGHKRTIRPNAKKLGSLFLAKPNMTWDEFSSTLRKLQKGFMGEPNELRPGTGQFFEYPEACICESPTATKEKLAQKGSFRDDVPVSDNGADNDYDDDDDDDDDDDEENVAESVHRIASHPYNNKDSEGHVAQEGLIERANRTDTQKISLFSD